MTDQKPSGSTHHWMSTNPSPVGERLGAHGLLEVLPDRWRSQEAAVIAGVPSAPSAWHTPEPWYQQRTRIVPAEGRRGAEAVAELVGQRHARAIASASFVATVLAPREAAARAAAAGRQRAADRLDQQRREVAHSVAELVTFKAPTTKE